MAAALLLYLPLLPGLAGAFNLDTERVIVRRGEPGSLFGFSLAMHRQLQPQERRLLLVGAPREKAFPSQQANRTGGLYSCDITSSNTHCTRVVFDEESFSLDSGKGIVSQDEMTFVSGAPRANHSGAVVLLKKEKNQRALSLERIFEGEGLASSFGYDVAVVDLNSDGWQDIVVGAPQYFDRSGDIGGAVYIYINQQGKWEGVKPVRLNGTADSMFGLAVENVGDVNQDGYPDIAVGAPYDGSGKVYIYHGSKNGINTKPAQILDGEKTGTNFFGYSIAGNMDLDKNSYPDIAVGSLSDSVSVFRSRPVISIMKSITVQPDKLDLKKRNSEDPGEIWMDVKACFHYTANPSNLNPRIKINYTFEAEKERKQLNMHSRVLFKDHQSDTFNASTTLNGQNSKQCVTTKLVLQDVVKDKLRPIPVSVSVEIAGLESSSSSTRKEKALPDLIPILDSNEPKTTVAKVEFLKEGCGEDNKCHSNLNLQYRFCTREGNEDRFTYLPIEKGMPVLVLKDQKDIALEITVTNNPSDAKNPQKDGEDAYEAKLIATFPDSLTYSAFREMRGYPEKQLTCGANQNGSQAECELGNPFKRNSNVTFYLILSTTKVNVDTTDLDINLKLETTSTQANLTTITASAKVVLELFLSLTGVAKPSQVYFGGNVIGESAMKSEDNIGNLIEYEFRVTNLGRPLKTFGTASLDIQWPKEISNGKWLLYLMKIDSKGLEKVSCQPQNEINSLRLAESHNSRRKREVAEKQITDSKAFSLFSERKYKTLDCNVNARCVDIKCPLKGFDSKASILLRSRLWNSTFVEEYSKMNYLDILVRASISVPAAAKNVKLTNEIAQVRVTVFPAKPVALYTGVPWWIIVVAIFAGILMLALLVFLLWKCGFFKRNKKDHYDATYHKAEIHAQPSDKERLTSDA
ncbi:integrin alpha-6 isoform 2-T2 [Mergus octosetaceus]